MGNIHKNKVDDIRYNKYYTNLVEITGKNNSNLKILKSNGDVFYLKYNEKKTDKITLDMLLIIPYNSYNDNYLKMGNKFSNFLGINGSTTLQNYIIKAKEYNLIKNNIVYLPVL